ncbi:DMT family transporter [Alphaproteobacteria bacterium]|nr:DMT family transporter [Alphaproteobacteria bacterium]
MLIKLKSIWDKLPPNSKGIIWALLSALFMSGMATLIKILGEDMSSFQIAWFRAFFGLIILFPFVYKAGGLKVLKTKKLGMHFLRSSLGALAMISGFYAVTVLPLTLITSIGFSRPLFMVPLAIIFLNEVVRARRWSATIIGFLGVLIVIRPSEGIEMAVIIGLFSSFMVAMSMIVTKKMTSYESPLAMMFFQGVFGSIITFIPCLYFWTSISIKEFLLLFLLAFFGTISVNFMIRALKISDATIVAPIEYVRIIFASIIGFYVFFEIPSIYTFLGSFVIICSTVYIAFRDSRLGKEKVISDID